MTTPLNTKQIQVDALTQLRLQRAEVQRQLDASQKSIKEHYAKLTERKAVPRNRAGSIMGLFDQGVAIVDGVFLGMKIIGSIRKLFRRKS